MKNYNRIISAILALILVLSIGLCTVSCMEDPIKLLEKGAKTSAAVLMKKQAAAQTIDYTEGVSAQINVPLDWVFESFVSSLGMSAGELTQKPTLDLKLDMNKSGEGSVNADICVGDEKVDIDLYKNSDYIAINSDSILGKSYSLKYEGEKEKFDKSVFGKNGSLSLGIEYDELVEVLKTLRTQNGAEENSDEIKKDAEEYLSQMIELVKKYSEAEKNDGSITIGENTIDTKKVVLTFTGENLYGFIKDSMDISFDYIEKIVQLTNVIDVSGQTASILENKDEILNEIEEQKDEITASTMIAEFHLTKKNQIIGFTLNIDLNNDSDKVFLAVLLGPSLEDVTDVSAGLKIKDSGEETEGTAIAHIDRKDDNTTVTVKINSDMIEDSSVIIDYKKTSGEYKINADIDEETFGVNGIIKAENDLIDFSVDSLSIDGETIKLGLTGKITPDPEVKAISDGNSVFDITDTEVENIVYGGTMKLIELINKTVQ